MLTSGAAVDDPGYQLQMEATSPATSQGDQDGVDNYSSAPKTRLLLKKTRIVSDTPKISVDIAEDCDEVARQEQVRD